MTLGVNENSLRSVCSVSACAGQVWTRADAIRIPDRSGPNFQRQGAKRVDLLLWPADAVQQICLDMQPRHSWLEEHMTTQRSEDYDPSPLLTSLVKTSLVFDETGIGR